MVQGSFPEQSGLEAIYIKHILWVDAMPLSLTYFIQNILMYFPSSMAQFSWSIPGAPEGVLWVLLHPWLTKGFWRKLKE